MRNSITKSFALAAVLIIGLSIMSSLALAETGQVKEKPVVKKVSSPKKVTESVIVVKTGTVVPSYYLHVKLNKNKKL